MVGVDGSAASDRALAWAAVRAFAGDTSLHIVYVVQTRVWFDPCGHTAFVDIESPERAQQILGEAVRSARSHVPWVQVTTQVRGADRATALVDEGRLAELIVLGRNRRRRTIGWFDASVTAQVARRASGRVVIVGPDDEFLV